MIEHVEPSRQDAPPPPPEDWWSDLDVPPPDEIADLDPLRPPLTGEELARFQELLDHEDHGAAPGWAVPGVDDRCDGGAGLSGASWAALTEAGAAWQGLRRAQARCYRALVGLDASDAVAESGYRSLSGLLGDHVRIHPDDALRLDRHAHSLTPTVSPTGAPVPAELPATAALVTAGVIGPGHVEVVRRTLRRLAAVVPALAPDVLATTEAQLAELATTRTPAALAEAATAILALLDPDGTAPDDDPPPENELHYLRRRDGSLAGKFVYRDPAAAATLHTALSAATPPDPTVGVTDDPDPGRPRRGPNPEALAALTLPERRAHALLDLATEALTRGLNTTDRHDGHEDTAVRDVDDADNEDDPDRTCADEDDADERDSAGRPGTRRPPDPPPGPPAWTRADLEGGDRVALTLTLNYDTLRAALTTDSGPGHAAAGYTGQLGLLGENTWIRPDTARRLACDAEIIPAVLGSHSEVLDLGRKHRLATLALRRAVTHRDRHCAHPGCRRRARRCQVHHITHWIDRGDTCPENCVLLCRYHHTLIHHSGWQIHMTNGLPWFTPPAWLDPDRQPRHNRPWDAGAAAA